MSTPPVPNVNTVVKTAKTYGRDLAERVIWTFLGGTTAVVTAAGPADMFHASLWQAAGVGGLAAHRVGRDVAELAVEVAVIGAAAEFAVGRERQPGARLQGDCLRNRFVLRRLQRVVADLATCVALPALEQRGGPQQAADVLGAKRRSG